MSMKYLGETFDLHAGGVDLKFPHHENEIAQSEGATDKLFAKYWLHAEHLKVEGETMSKSLGNYYTFRDLIEKGYSAKAIRYTYLSVPYHKQFNFTFDTLNGAESTLERLRDFRKRLAEARVGSSSVSAGSNDSEALADTRVTDAAETALRDFEAAMDDNLNTSVALAVLHNLVREINTALAEETLSENGREKVLQAIEKIDSVLQIFGEESAEMLDAEIEALIEERQEARRNRNFARSDEIRDLLAEKGIVLEDTKDGVRWKKSETRTK